MRIDIEAIESTKECQTLLILTEQPNFTDQS